MNSLTTIIFDFDGVIADTESIFAKFDSKLINSYLEKAGSSHKTTPKDIRKFAGGTGEEKLIKTGHIIGIDLSACEQAFSKERNQKRKNLFAENKPASGKNLDKLLDKLGRNNTALATNRLRSKLYEDLQHIGNSDLFDIIITSDPPMRRKPAPDMIIEAVKRLNANPDKCAYIGDNPSDMIAAIAAKITPIGFIIEGINKAPDRAKDLKKHSAELIIDDFAQLIPYI